MPEPLKKAVPSTAHQTPEIEGSLEGLFAVPLEEMIRLLNSLLSKEYNSWLTYIHFSQMIRGFYRESLAEIFNEHAEEELKHVFALSRRIVALGGITTTKVGDVPEAKTTEEMIETLIRQEQEAIKAYRDVMRVIGDNEGLRQVVENIIDKEQEHTDELWLLLPGTPIDIPEAVIAGFQKIGTVYPLNKSSLNSFLDFLDLLEKVVSAESESEKTNVPGSPYLTRILKDDGIKTLYEVAKFEEHKEPEAVYHILRKRGAGSHEHWSCDCPGYRSRGKCKHISMVQAWDRAGRKLHPMFWGDVGVNFKKLMDTVRRQTRNPLEQSHKFKSKKKNVVPKVRVPHIVKNPDLGAPTTKMIKKEVHGPVKLVEKKIFRLRRT